MVNPISTKIFATLGNNSSLIPLGIKDVGNTLGMTAGSYVTGNSVEGKDRFIDEFGTQIIWLLGIPFFKKVIDKTVYKAAKLNPDIDIRLLNNKDIFKKAKEHAAPELQKDFDRVLSKEKLFKNISLAKFGVATALTLASYSALTVFRHKHTEKTILKELKAEMQEKKEQAENNKSNEKPSFGMNLSGLKQFMFDPVKNTMIIDGGITTERLAESRNPQDFMGYVIKEGGFWVSMYFLGPWVQKVIEKNAAKKNKPIDLDIRVLQDEKFQKAIKDGSIKAHLDDLNVKISDGELYDSLFKKGDNLLVQMMKKAEIVKTVKNSDKIDSTQFIDPESIKGSVEKVKKNWFTNKTKTKVNIGFKEHVEKFYKAAQESGNIDDFFKTAIKTKRWSIMKNMGASIGALGIVVPGIMVAMRYLDKDNKEFAVKKELKEKLMKNPDFMGEG